MMRLSLLSIVILIYYRITAVISVHNIVTRTDGLVFLNYAANDENQPPMYETDEEEYEINAPLGEALDDLIPFTNGYYGFKLASKSAKNIYGQWGLSLKRWIFRDENTAIGIGLYEHDSKSDRVTIKCSRNKLQNAHDEYILRLIDLAKKQRNFLATGSRWVSQRLHDFWVGKYHCMVTSNPGHMSFRQLVVNLREDDKPKVLPWYYQMLIRAVAFLHFAGVAHNNINPDNIRYVRGPRGSYGEMILTNYTQATTFRLTTSVNQ
ncbi:hypothetical protein BDF22DRAFT_164016 [Syncephalis plumigaleata]|nr:hypothetical protein BDF22DRAFT_164016 [Syncephalis plumigaleata]